MEMKKSGISIAVPEGWEDQTIYTYKGPDDNGIQHNLIVQVDPELETDDLFTYSQQRIQALKDSLPGFELLSETERKLKSGLMGYDAVFKWVPSEGKVIFQKQVYVISGGKAYCFTASFSKHTLKTIGCDVDAMIDSFSAG
jgi:hypothetical protein